MGGTTNIIGLVGICSSRLCCGAWVQNYWRLPSFSALGLVVIVVVGGGIVGPGVFPGRGLVDSPFSLLAVDEATASKHVGSNSFIAVACRLVGAGGTGVAAVGAKTMGPAVVEPGGLLGVGGGSVGSVAWSTGKAVGTS